MSVTRHDPGSALRVDLRSQQISEWHFHDGHQLLYPRTGAVSVTTTSGTWVVPPLRAIWIPGTHPHQHHAHLRTVLCSLIFDGSTSRFKNPTLIHVSPLLREVILALTTDDPRIDDRDRYTSDERRHLETVVYDQLRPAAELDYYLPEPRDDRLRTLADLLRANPADPRSLSDLGTSVGASTRTLSRLFRADVGMSFPLWRARLRTQHACLALISGQAITTVAYDTGYSTVSAFSQAFRRNTGLSPSAYRAQSIESATS